MPNPALPVTSRSAWLALEPVRLDRARIIERRRRHLVRRREGSVADGERAAVGQRPRQGQARSAVAAAGVEMDVSVIDERAGRRHRGLVMERERSPGADQSEPRQSAVRPRRRAVLDEGVASVQAQLRVSGQAGDLTARELDRAVAGQSNIAAQDSRRAESRAARVTSRSAWLALEPCEIDPARIVERRRRHLVRRRERGVADA